MTDNRTELSINTEVVRKMAEIAALEVEGVKNISKISIDLKGALKAKTPFRGVLVESITGAIEININISVA